MKVKSYIAAILIVVSLTVPGALAQHPAGHGDMGKQDTKMADAPYDLRYIDMMIEYHQMGINIAKMAQNQTSHTELKKTRYEDDRRSAER